MAHLSRVSDELERLQAALAERYAVRRELARGGMATVYLAADLRHGREVAIKVLPPSVAGARGTERFLGEIRIAAGLTHPNILPLHDSGEAGGLLFFVMPFVEGPSLRDRLERSRCLGVTEAVPLSSEQLTELTQDLSTLRRLEMKAEARQLLTEILTRNLLDPAILADLPEPK